MIRAKEIDDLRLPMDSYLRGKTRQMDVVTPDVPRLHNAGELILSLTAPKTLRSANILPNSTRLNQSP